MIKVNDIKKNNKTNDKNSSITESLTMYSHNTTITQYFVRLLIFGQGGISHTEEQFLSHISRGRDLSVCKSNELCDSIQSRTQLQQPSSSSSSSTSFVKYVQRLIIICQETD